MAKKKKRPSGPRPHRMDRHGRLQSAKLWLAEQNGRTVVQIGKAYRKRYGVDWPCAIHELSQLGIVFEPGWVAGLQQSLEGHYRARAARRAARTSQPANGVPFGVTWEEWERLDGRGIPNSPNRPLIPSVLERTGLRP